MRSALRPCLAGLLALGAWVPAWAEDPLTESSARSVARPFHSGPVLDLGFTGGGENLLKPKLLGHYADDDYYYMGAGESAYIGIGLVELGGGSRLGLKQEVSYGVNDNCQGQFLPADSKHPCEVFFQHLNFEGLLLFGTGPEDDPWKTSLGAGIVYQKALSLDARNDDNSTAAHVDFAPAHGWMLQWQYDRLGIRFTHIVYRVPGSGVTIDGSNVGLFVGYQFGGG